MIIATPFGQPSLVPTAGAFVKMKGLIRGKVQEFDVELPEFAKKMGELFVEFPVPSTGILVRRTCFVMENGTEAGQQEHFDKPFLSIQQAMDSSGPDFERWCIVVYPGYYVGNLIIPPGLNLYFYGGAQIEGDITLGDGCNLQFESGTVVNGNITDGGNAVVANICGCVVLNGTLQVNNAASYIIAEGEELKSVTVGDGSLDLHFKRKTDVFGAFISIAGTGTINIIGLSFDATTSGNNIACDAAVVNLIGCDFSYTFAATLIDLASGILSIINCRLFSKNYCVVVSDTSSLRIDGCYQIESTDLYAIQGIAGTGDGIIRRSFITVANSVNVDQSAIRVDAGFTLVLDSCTILGKGAGFSVEGISPTSIQSQFGNQSNKIVDPVNITETVSTIQVDAAIV